MKETTKRLIVIVRYQKVIYPQCYEDDIRSVSVDKDTVIPLNSPKTEFSEDGFECFVE